VVSLRDVFFKCIDQVLFVVWPDLLSNSRSLKRKIGSEFSASVPS